MNLRNASTFLFIAAIIALFAELLRNMNLYTEVGSDGFSALMGVFILARILNAVLFLLIAISYRGKQYNPESRKLLGLFLAIFAGAQLLLDVYSFYDSFGLNFGMFYRLFNLIYLLSNIPLMLIGIALFGSNRQFIRGTMIAGMIVFACLTAMSLYEISNRLMNNNLLAGNRWMLFDLANMLTIVFPVAQFCWALAVYKRSGQPGTTNGTASVDDQL
jgi:hypothetical protein